MKLVFGIMSALQPAGTVASLVDALGLRHPILIHHDWSQQPDFRLSRPNVAFVENPQRTGWSTWGFSQGILRLVECAMARERFDYFQLLSPTCLPVRPIRDFELHLARTGADFLIDAVRLDSDPNVLMSHGWRAFASAGSLRQRMLRRARRWYFGEAPIVASRSGLSFPVTSLVEAAGMRATLARIGHTLTLQARNHNGFSHPFSSDFPCYAGSTWFTASRRGCDYLLERAADVSLIRRFASLSMGDEMFFPTLYKNSGLPCAPAVHYISPFIDARPAWLDLSSIEEIRRSGAYFARKFPEDAASPVRAAARALLVD
jgi:hypothetical protein